MWDLIFLSCTSAPAPETPRSSEAPTSSRPDPTPTDPDAVFDSLPEPLRGWFGEGRPRPDDTTARSLVLLEERLAAALDARPIDVTDRSDRKGWQIELWRSGPLPFPTAGP